MVSQIADPKAVEAAYREYREFMRHFRQYSREGEIGNEAAKAYCALVFEFAKAIEQKDEEAKEAALKNLEAQEPKLMRRIKKWRKENDFVPFVSAFHPCPNRRDEDGNPMECSRDPACPEGQCPVPRPPAPELRVV